VINHIIFVTYLSRTFSSL